MNAATFGSTLSSHAHQEFREGDVVKVMSHPGNASYVTVVRIGAVTGVAAGRGGCRSEFQIFGSSEWLPAARLVLVRRGVR